MIVAMLNDPVRRQSVFIVVIERENLDRMREADPITIESPRRGGIMPIPNYSDLSVLIAYEEDKEQLMEMVKKHDIRGLLQHLERGRKFIEEKDGAENTRRIPHPTEN